MAVMPLPTCSRIAATVASGECPVIDPVSPKQKSIYVFPSTSVKRAPLAFSTKTGYAPGHLAIHDIGTPPGMFFLPASKSWPLLGCKVKKRASSLARSSANRVRFIMTNPDPIVRKQIKPQCNPRQ